MPARRWRNGAWEYLDRGGRATPAGPVAPVAVSVDDLVPSGTAADVVAWVGDSLRRARAALAAEQDGKRRRTVIAHTMSVLAEEPDP